MSKLKCMAAGLLMLVSSMLLAGNPVIKLGVVADIQYDPGTGDHSISSRHYSEGVTRFSEAVSTFNSIGDLSFVTSLGDMTDHDPMSYADLKKVADGLEVPLYNVMGNHDMKPLKTAGEIAEARSLKGLEKTYYSFVKGGVRFIVLDCTDYDMVSHPESSARTREAVQWYEDLKSIGAARAQKYNGGIGLDQLNWLESELTKADRKGQYAIILCHMLLYPFDTRESLWNSMETVHLIERHQCVKAVFCGHRHSGGYDIRNGIHYVNFKGMVESDGCRYAVVTIDTVSKRILIKGYGDEVDRSLECR